MAFFAAQVQPFSLSGSGASSGSTSIKLSSMKDIAGNTLAMSSFGSKGYATLEPGSTNEEQISFTGITQNSDGTATLTGVSTVAFLQPYTETSATAKSHAGGTTLVISNTSGFYNKLTAKDDATTVTSVWTFSVTPIFPNNPVNQTDGANKAYIDGVAIAGAPNASTTVQGLTQLANHSQVANKSSTGSTGAKLVITPDQMPSTSIYDYVADTGSVNTYAIAPSPAVTSYTAGLKVYFKAKTTNSGAATLNVNSLGAKNLVRNKNISLSANDITTNYLVGAMYDGVQFQMDTTNPAKISIDSREIFATSTTGTTAYAAALVPATTSYVAGLEVNFKPDTGGANATLNINSLGAKNIKKYSPGGSLVNVVTGDIVANQIVKVIYDSANSCFQLITPPSTGNLGSQFLTSSGSGAGASLSITGLTKYQNYLVVIDTIASVGTNVSLFVALSSNNGSSYGSARQITTPSASGGAQTVNGGFQILNAGQSGVNKLVVPSTVSTGTGNAGVYTTPANENSITGVINAIQFTWTGNNFNGGNFYVYGL